VPQTPTKVPSNGTHKEDLALQAFGFDDEVLPEGDQSLLLWAHDYLEAEVVGLKSLHTVDAQTRDLASFIRWFAGANRHLVVSDWARHDTQAYLDQLKELGRAPATINRHLATLRRFARWAHDQPHTPFANSGSPVRNISDLAIEEPTAKKVGRRDLHALIKAADRLVNTEKRSNARPHRNRAIFHLLWQTGLRVSELIALRRDQYDGSHLINVWRKGKRQSRKVYIRKDARRHLDSYLNHERPLDDPDDEAKPLFIARVGERPAAALHRRRIQTILAHIAQEASKHRDKPIHLHPHRLRHTFGFEVFSKSGSVHETAMLLGQATDKYAPRYSRMTDKEREDMLEDMDQNLPSAPAKRGSLQKRRKRKHYRAPRIQRDIRVMLHLRVEDNSKFVQAKKKARRQIELLCLSDYNMKKLEEGGWEYELSIPHRDDEELDRIVYDLLSACESVADDHQCFIEADVWSVENPERSW
jgi:integrase/recombinase XerD